MNLKPTFLSLLLSILAFNGFSAPVQADTLQGGVSEKGYAANTGLNGGTSYPAPQMIKAQPAVQAPQQPMKAAVQQHAPLQAGATKSIALPAGFMGKWLVKGARRKVEASPEFQAAAENAFAVSTTNYWNIVGDPQKGYTIESDSGINTQLYVDKVGPGTAIIRYQHPVKNTMAQESVILSGGGATFEGLERISIIKQGQPPRAKVEYALNGTRQH